MHNPVEVERFEGDLKRYFTRKIGLEAVMRVRCTKGTTYVLLVIHQLEFSPSITQVHLTLLYILVGLSIHSFHGNFFVRSTDLLSLPNINPDAAFGMQVAIEENLTDSPYACLQAALLYTSSKGIHTASSDSIWFSDPNLTSFHYLSGERRIRVHTLCLPVSTSLPDIINSADQQAIAGLLAKMGQYTIMSPYIFDKLLMIRFQHPYALVSCFL